MNYIYTLLLLLLLNVSAKLYCNISMSTKMDITLSKSCIITSSAIRYSYCNYEENGIYRLAKINAKGVINGKNVSNILGKLPFDGERYTNFNMIPTVSANGHQFNGGNLASIESLIPTLYNTNITCYFYDGNWYVFSDKTENTQSKSSGDYIYFEFYTLVLMLILTLF